MPARRCLMLLADGARADIFERLLPAGTCPNIQRHVVDRGGYRRAALHLHQHHRPSPPAVPHRVLPGTADVPGYAGSTARLPPRPARRPLVHALLQRPRGVPLREGPGSRGTQTVYHLVDGAINVVRRRDRGRREGQLAVRAREEPGLAVGPLRATTTRAPTSSPRGRPRRRSIAAPRSRSSSSPGIDWQSHYVDAEGPGAMRSYGRSTGRSARAAKQLQHLGGYDDTLIVVCSDHGHSPVARALRPARPRSRPTRAARRVPLVAHASARNPTRSPACRATACARSTLLAPAAGSPAEPRRGRRPLSRPARGPARRARRWTSSVTRATEPRLAVGRVAPGPRTAA